jgi:hypothetical protein
MKRKILKLQLENTYDSEFTIKSILYGRRKPSYLKMCELNSKYKIPFTAWKDIKSYLQGNSTPKKSSEQELHRDKDSA